MVNLCHEMPYYRIIGLNDPCKCTRRQSLSRGASNLKFNLKLILTLVFKLSLPVARV